MTISNDLTTAIQVQAGVVKRFAQLFRQYTFFCFYDVSQQIRLEHITFQLNPNNTFLIRRKFAIILRLFCNIWVLVHIIWSCPTKTRHLHTCEHNFCIKQKQIISGSKHQLFSPIIFIATKVMPFSLSSCGLVIFKNQRMYDILQNYT